MLQLVSECAEAIMLPGCRRIKVPQVTTPDVATVGRSCTFTESQSRDFCLLVEERGRREGSFREVRATVFLLLQCHCKVLP